MKNVRTDREVSSALMWDWIWPSFLIELLFAASFVILPHPSLTKATVSILLVLVHLLVTYRVRWKHQVARLWHIFHLIGFCNLMFFTTGFAALTGFRLQWPQDVGYLALVIAGLAGIVVLTWRYYTPGMRELLENDSHTGRFNLEKGVFSLLVPPTFYEFKTPFLRKSAAIFISSSGVLVAVSAASGVREGYRLLRRDIGIGMLFLVMAALFIGAATCTFYVYRWIRRWEKATGRTMWIKGFEPQS